MVVGGGSSAALDLLAALSHRGVACITRLRLDAILHDPALPRAPGTVGPPGQGGRLPVLAAALTNPATFWQRVTVPGWYGSSERVVEISSATAV